MTVYQSPPGGTQPPKKERRRVLLETLGIIAAICAVITGVVGVVRLFADEKGDDGTAAYQQQVVDTCNQVLAITKEQAANPAIDLATGKVKMDVFVQLGKAQLNREKAAFDQLMTQTPPDSLKNDKAKAEHAIQDWYGQTMTVFLPQLRAALPARASFVEINAASEALRPTYGPVVAALNNALTTLAGKTCTAISY